MIKCSGVYTATLYGIRKVAAADVKWLNILFASAGIDKNHWIEYNIT